MKGISSTALEEKLQTLEQVKKDSPYELACVKSDQIAKLYSPDEIKSNLIKYKKYSNVEILKNVSQLLSNLFRK